MENTRSTVLVVDDNELNRELLIDMLDEDCNVLEACNGIEALRLVEEDPGRLNAMLLDLVMPEMDGNAVLETMRARGLTDRFPILIITGENSVEIEARCLQLGASDFIHKPFRPELVRHRLNNAMALFTYKNNLEEQVARQTQQLRQQADELRAQNAKLTKINADTIELLSNVVEARSLESGTHVKRVKKFTRCLAKQVMARFPEYGLTPELLERIEIASSMHDIGKISVPDAILLKPGKLTPEEFAEMKRHTVYGVKVLEDSRHLWSTDYYQMSVNICRHHHEKWDGRGYPDGLAGDDIPIEAQIVAVADCYDALTTERVYKKAFTPDEAFRMITGGECGAMNPKLLECLTLCREDFANLAVTLR